MGYDLKAGYMVRGYGGDPAFERDGRRQQLFTAMFAFVIAGVVVTDRLSGVLRAEPGGAGGPRLCRDDQGRRVGGCGVVAGVVGNSRGDHPVPWRATPPAWHPARDGIADPVSAGRLGGAERHSLPHPVGALRLGRGHGSVRRWRDRGRCAVRVLHLHMEGGHEVVGKRTRMPTRYAVVLSGGPMVGSLRVSRRWRDA